ncbi:MAG TPA: ribosomal protein L7/L12 [Trebonia sp.]
MLSAYRVALLAVVPAVIITAVALGVRKVRRSGEPVRDVVLRQRQRARARVDSADKLHAEAPRAAGIAALASFPAVILALVATPHGARGVYLPPAADARWQLWCIAIAVAGAVAALDYWLGLGTCVKALTTDSVTAATVAATAALAATSPLMVSWQVESRPAWLAVIAAQFSWPFAGMILGAAVSERRKRRLSPPAPRRSPDSWLAEYGIDANRDLILVSPGSRKIRVISAVRTLTGMRLKEAKDLIDNAPGLVMHHVTSGQADLAKELLESLGATVTVSDDPGQA